MEAYLKLIENHRLSGSRNWVSRNSLSIKDDQAFIGCCFALSHVSSVMSMWMEAEMPIEDFWFFVDNEYAKHISAFLGISMEFSGKSKTNLHTACQSIVSFIQERNIEREKIAFRLFVILLLCAYCIESIQSPELDRLGEVPFSAVPFIHSAFVEKYCETFSECKPVLSMYEKTRLLRLDSLITHFLGDGKKQRFQGTSTQAEES